MLRKCKGCPHYIRLIQLGQMNVHHFCMHHKLPYVFLKNHGLLKECPSFSFKLEEKPQEGHV